MRVAVIVLAHTGPDHVAKLLSALRYPQVRAYLHVDRRTRLKPFTRSLSHARLGDVQMLPRRATVWGSPAAVDASLDGLTAGIADDCGYFFLITGQDFPLYPVSEIIGFAESAGDRSYVGHWPVSESRHRFNGRDRTDFYTYTVLGRRALCIPRGEDANLLGRKGRAINQVLRARSGFQAVRRFPSYVRPFAGHAWWNLSRSAAEFVVQFVREHPDYRRYHQHTWSPDELFYQSILAGTSYSTEHELINDPKRFYVWQGMHVRALTSADFANLSKSNDLFARKFDCRASEALLTQLLERPHPALERWGD